MKNCMRPCEPLFSFRIFNYLVVVGSIKPYPLCPIHKEYVEEQETQLKEIFKDDKFVIYPKERTITPADLAYTSLQYGLDEFSMFYGHFPTWLICSKESFNRMGKSKIVLKFMRDMGFLSDVKFYKSDGDDSWSLLGGGNVWSNPGV